MTEERPETCTRTPRMCNEECIWPTCMTEKEQQKLAEKIMKDL